MPELNGLQVLDRIGHEPAVIFTTAYDRYSVSAFELEALDYLLKPFDGSRMQIEMRDGTKILASRTRSKELRQLAI